MKWLLNLFRRKPQPAPPAPPAPPKLLAHGGNEIEPKGLAITFRDHKTVYGPVHSPSDPRNDPKHRPNPGPSIWMIGRQTAIAARLSRNLEPLKSMSAAAKRALSRKGRAVP